MAPTGPLTVVMIRHAERVAIGTDPALSAAGRARASLLARMLADAGVVAVYVTGTLRSKQTGTPTAQRAGVATTVYDALDAAGLAVVIRAAHPSGTVLVVAHSNTIDDIAAAFGVPGVRELAETQFDRMLVITVAPGAAPSALHLRYGADTP